MQINKTEKILQELQKDGKAQTLFIPDSLNEALQKIHEDTQRKLTLSEIGAAKCIVA